MNNNNYIDNQKGRKYSWLRIKFIGEFTMYDFIISFIMFSILIFIIVFFKSVIWSIISFVLLYIITIILIKEWSGIKSYELFVSMILFIFRKKKISLDKIMEKKDE